MIHLWYTLTQPTLRTRTNLRRIGFSRDKLWILDNYSLSAVDTLQFTINKRRHGLGHVDKKKTQGMGPSIWGLRTNGEDQGKDIIYMSN